MPLPGFWLRHAWHGPVDVTADPPGPPLFAWCARCGTGRYLRYRSAR